MMPITLDAAFASVGELKARLGITTSTGDAVRGEILTGVSRAMESYAGRPLMRRHGVTEFFRGTGRTIRLSASPVAHVHSVRESETSDFDTAGNYEELAEGADFVLDSTGEGAPAGQSGVLRRINGPWPGSENSLARTRVVYTGGYKTDTERNKENGQIVFGQNASDNVYDYDIKVFPYSSATRIFTAERLTEQELALNQAVVGSDIEERRAFIRFFTKGELLPSWSVVRLRLSIAYRSLSQISDMQAAVITLDPSQPALAGLEKIWTAGRSSDPEDAEYVKLPTATNWGSTGGILTPVLLDTDLIEPPHTWLERIQAVVDRTIGEGFIAIAVSAAFTGSTLYLYMGAHEHATATNRPVLTVDYANRFSDSFDVPDDLRHACLVQSIHDYRTRLSPGTLEESSRGVQVATGSSYVKGPAELLPEVKAVLDHYRRLI